MKAEHVISSCYFLIPALFDRRGIFSYESTTTRTTSGLDFSAKCGKRQGHVMAQSFRVKPGEEHPVWKTQSQEIRRQNYRF
jgi:hypothetical protein